MNKKIPCNCLIWARTFDEPLISVHHPKCEFRNIEHEAKEHLEKLIKALEYEASMGDGISEEFYQDYLNAKFFVGQRVFPRNQENSNNALPIAPPKSNIT